MNKKEDEKETKYSGTLYHGQTHKSTKEIKSFSVRAPFWTSVKLGIKRKIRHELAKRDSRHR
ncbi:MAG: hypothetical protein ACXAAO_11520 [Candidatus Thorarchaeota archaeon]|jgi:hypothetical protein